MAPSGCYTQTWDKESQMILGDLIGTTRPEKPLTPAENTLVVVARGAAVPGAAMAAMGTVVPLLFGGVTVQAALGGAGFVAGGVLWVLGQGLVARWISDRNPQTLFLALWCGVLTVAAASLGMGMVAGFSGSFASRLAVAGAVVACGQAALVTYVDPGWAARKTAPPAVNSVPLWDVEEARLILRGLAHLGVALGVSAGVLVAGQFVYYVANWEEDWNVLGAVFVSPWLFALAGAWCLPQLVLLEWAGGPRRPPVPVVLAGAAGWAGLVGAGSYFELPFLVLPALVGGLVVLEVVLASMIVWHRLGGRPDASTDLT